IRVNSFTSTFVFIGAVVYIMVAPKGREDPTSLRGNAPEPEVPEESPVDEVAKELAAVTATTGVVAAAKIAGQADVEDAKAVGDTPEPEVPAAVAAIDEGGVEEPSESVTVEEPSEQAVEAELEAVPAGSPDGEAEAVSADEAAEASAGVGPEPQDVEDAQESAA